MFRGFDSHRRGRRHKRILSIIASLLLISALSPEVLAADEQESWVLEQNNRYCGAFTSVIGKNCLLVTFNSGAQIYAAAPDWTVYVYNKKGGCYSAVDCQMFAKAGIHPFILVEHAHWETLEALKQAFGKRAAGSKGRIPKPPAPVCGQPVAIIKEQFSHPVDVEVHSLTLSHRSEVSYKHASCRKTVLATNIVLGNQQAMILATVYASSVACDRAILLREFEFDDNSHFPDVETLTVKREKRELKFDPTITKLTRRTLPSQVIYAGKVSEMTNMLDGFGFGK